MYESFYNLTKNPFRLNSDPDFFFTSASHSRALDYLRYGVAEAEGFIVITGLPGMGKTMLVKALCEELYDQDIVVAQLVTTQVDRDDIIRLVAGGFGLSHYGLTKAALLNALENYFISKIRKGKRVLLVVDEAHYLSPQSIEELRLLMNLEDQGRQLFQCFLLGQEQLKSTLQLAELEQARQRVIAAYDLKPLNAQETQQYVEFRLGKAGWSGTPEFLSQAFKKIFQYSEGVPRKINLVCNRALAFGYLDELKTINEKVIELVIKELNEELFAGNSTPKSTHSNVINFDRAVEARLRRLESKVDDLKDRLRKERRLLRQVLLHMEVQSGEQSNDNYQPKDDSSD